MKSVTADKLSLELDAILTDYSDDVWEEVQKISKEVADEAAKKLKSSSPKQSGQYASGWKVKTQKGPRRISCVVYNAKKPQLTHLLEWGHVNAATGRRVAAESHIEPVEEWANQEFEKRVKEAVQK